MSALPTASSVGRNLAVVGDDLFHLGQGTGRGRPPLAWARAVVSCAWSGLRGFASVTTWRAVANVVVSTVVGTAFVLVLAVSLAASAAVSWIVGIGQASLAGTLRLGWWMARFDAARLRRLGGCEIELPESPRQPRDTPRRDARRAWTRSTSAWRLVVYQFARLPVAAALAAVVFGWWWLVAFIDGWWPDVSPRQLVRLGPLLLELVCVLLWPSIVRRVSNLDVVVARILLAPSRNQQLSAEVQRLGEARSQAVAAAEAERRRIERDLHDGLQPRLVSLGVDLSLAEARFDCDPDASRALLARARDDTKTTIEELRALVRGIHPSVLDGRGLDAALSALVAHSPVPVALRVDLLVPVDRASEAAAYYVVAEGLANIAKHSDADRGAVTVLSTSAGLQVLVEDEGRGGAILEPGGGLAGLSARVRAIDGTFVLSSPPGGPTRLEAVIPCES